MIIEQHWLVEIGLHGIPKLVDGPHSDRAGVEQALHLFNQFGFSKGKQYMAAHVVLSEVESKAHGTNEEAVKTIQSVLIR